MPKSTRDDQASALARNLKAALAANGIDLNHQKALDVVARLGGAANLHVAQAAIVQAQPAPVAKAETRKLVCDGFLAMAKVCGFTAPTVWLDAAYPDCTAGFEIRQHGHKTLSIVAEPTRGLDGMDESIAGLAAIRAESSHGSMQITLPFYKGMMDLICELGGGDNDDGTGDWSGDVTMTFDADGNPRRAADQRPNDASVLGANAQNIVDEARAAGLPVTETRDEDGRTAVVTVHFGGNRESRRAQMMVVGTLTAHQTRVSEGRTTHLAIISGTSKDKAFRLTVIAEEPLPTGFGTLVAQVVRPIGGGTLLRAVAWKPSQAEAAA